MKTTGNGLGRRTMRTIAATLCLLVAFPSPTEDAVVRSCSGATMTWASETLDAALSSMHSGDRGAKVAGSFDAGAWTSFEGWTRSLVRTARSSGLSIDPSVPVDGGSRTGRLAGECEAKLIVTTTHPDGATDPVATVARLVVRKDAGGLPSISRLSFERMPTTEAGRIAVEGPS